MTNDVVFLTREDRDFIHDIDQRFPAKKISENFLRYLLLSPQERVAQAKIDRQKLLRAGWIKRGMPIADTETVDEHVEGMKSIAREHLAFHENLNEIIDIIECHDTAEVIVSDFIPGDLITSIEKRQIELLATRLIYEAEPHMIERYLDYEDQRTPEAKIVKDLDKGQMYMRANAYNVTHPHINLNEFAVDCQNYQWRTKEGTHICGALNLKP